MTGWTSGRRRLPDVVQLLPSKLHAERQRQRRSFLIEEILHPDFGRRRSTAPPPADRRQPEVGNHVTNSIWQPFVASPEPRCGQDSAAERGGLSRTRTHACDNRMKKSAARRKPPSTDDAVGGRTLNCSQVADDESAVSRQPIAATTADFVSSSSRSSSSSSSSVSCSSGSDVSTDVTCSQGARNSDAPQAKFGKLALPAWVYCTRYSDRPSSGIMHSPYLSISIILGNLFVCVRSTCVDNVSVLLVK